MKLNRRSYIVASTDQGTTWTPADGGFPDGIVLNFAIDPTMRGTVYARYVQTSNTAPTMLGFAKSDDRGASWTTINNGLPLTYPLTSLVAVGNSVLYSTFSNSYNFGAIFQSTDGGSTWHAAQAGPAITDIPGLAIDPLRPGIVYAAGGADGVFRSADRGANWSKLDAVPPNQFGVTGGNALSVTIDSRNPDVLYTTTPCSLYKSTDGGATWSNENIVPTVYRQSASSVSMDPRNSNTLYLTQSPLDGGSGLQKTTNGGMTWSYIWSSDEIYLQAVAIDPTNPSTIYAGSSGGLIKTVDGGVTWNDSNLAFGVSALSINPVHPDVIYAAAATDFGPTNFSGLFKSVDGGTTWSAIDSGLDILTGTRAAVTALAFDPANPEVVFAGTSGNGVFRTTDSGNHWTPFNEELEDFDTMPLVTANGRPDYLYASTHGGVFVVPLRSGLREDRK